MQFQCAHLCTSDECAPRLVRRHFEPALCEPDVRVNWRQRREGAWCGGCKGVVTPSPFYAKMEGVGGWPGVTSQSSERKLGLLGHLAAPVPC